MVVMNTSWLRSCDSFWKMIFTNSPHYYPFCKWSRKSVLQHLKKGFLCYHVNFVYSSKPGLTYTKLHCNKNLNFCLYNPIRKLLPSGYWVNFFGKAYFGCNYRGYSTSLCRHNMDYSTSYELSKPSVLAIKIFHDAVESVKPSNFIPAKVELKNSTLIIKDNINIEVNLTEFNKLFVVGFGKAVLPMAEQVCSLLTGKVSRCLVNIPDGFRNSNVPEIEITRGASNNLPDKSALEGTRKIVQLVEKECGEKDLLIVLISGGGSALFVNPVYSISIEEKSQLVQSLSRAGASISELNSVRKRLSLVKGGGLLKLTKANRIISLILSDVVGDPIDTIASGPTTPNTDPPYLARDILQKYLDFSELPANIKDAVTRNYPNLSADKKTVNNIILANNGVALDRAAETARNLNLLPVVLTTTLEGEAIVVGELLAELCKFTTAILLSNGSNNCKSLIVKIMDICDELKIPDERKAKLVEVFENHKNFIEVDGICLLMGGETTVKVRGSGIGGRNQEVALSAAKAFSDLYSSENYSEWTGKIAVLSAGSDGIDGPCDAAGAVVDPETARVGRNQKLNVSEYLQNNDSYTYFKKHFHGMHQIRTGHTETNVMDIVVLVAMK